MARTGNAAIYDRLRDRMLMFGGREIWEYRLQAPEGWKMIGLSDIRGPAHGGYDPARDRIVTLDDRHDHLYVLPLSGGPLQWAAIPLTGGPGSRARSSVEIDPKRDRILLIGGEDLSAEYNDVWALSLSDPPTWTQIHPDGNQPAPRSGHTCTYDAANDRMLLSGGISQGRLTGDTWALELGNGPQWNLIDNSRPDSVGHFGHVAVYDSASRRLILVGGQNPNFATASVLDLSGTPRWSHYYFGLSPQYTLYDFAMILDPVRRRLILNGGTDVICEWANTFIAPLGDLSSWSDVTFKPNLIVSYHNGYTCDATRHWLVSGSGFLIEDDLYYPDFGALSFDGRVSAIRLAYGPARADIVLADDPVRDELVSFGGWNARDAWEVFNDLQVMPMPGGPWRAVATRGDTPPVTTGWTGTFESARERLWLWLGTSSLWYVGMADSTWHRLDTVGPHPGLATLLVGPGDSPADRDPNRGRSLAKHPQRLRILAREWKTGALWGLDESTPAWLPIATTGPAPPPGGFVAADSTRGIVLALGAADELYVLTLVNATWRVVPTQGEPPALVTAIGYDPNASSILVWGAWVDDPRASEGCSGSGIWRMDIQLDLPERAPAAESAAWLDPSASNILALDPPTPNPGWGPLRVSFSLAASNAAMLELIDVQGRCLAREDVGALGPGHHDVVLRQGVAPAPGLYFVRLSQAGHICTRRLVRIR